MEWGENYEADKIAMEADVGTHLSVIRFFNKSLRNKDNNLWVAKDGDKVVGVIGWYQDKGSYIKPLLGKKLFPTGDKIFWVSFFAVSEDLRGGGVGIMLMKKLIQELEYKKAKELWTYTSRARKFYEKMGFERITNKMINDEPHDFLKREF